MGPSYTVSMEKRGLIVYLAALKKGAIRAAHPYHVIYRELPSRATDVLELCNASLINF